MRARARGLSLPPLPLVAAGYIAGTMLAAAAAREGSAVGAIGGLAGMGALLGGLVMTSRTRPLIAVATLALAAVAVARYEQDATRVPALARLGGTHDFEGVVAADPVARGRFGAMVVAVRTVDGAASEGRLRVRYVLGSTPLLEGDRVALRGVLEPPDASGMRHRAVDAELAFPDSLVVRARNEGNALDRTLRALRRRVVHHIERSLPEPESSLAVGMLIGRQGTLPAALNEDLRATGTTHLVVASGQNVALFLGLVASVGATLIPRRRAAVLALAALPAYVLLLGADPPIVRAALMALGITLSTALGRRTPGWISLLYAAAAMLAAAPSLIDDVSFQLSATATAGVIVVAPALAEAATRVLRAPATGLAAAAIEAWATSTGALATVLPVEAAAFGSMPVAAVPANVLAAPLYVATLVVAQAAALFGWHDAVADTIWSAGVAAPRLFVDMVAGLASAGAATLPSDRPLLLATGWYAVLAATAWLLHDPTPARLEARGGGRGLLPAAAALLLLGTWVGAGDGGAADVPRVTVLDVGQGLAVLVRDGRGAVLIDAGPPDGAVMRALPRGTPRTLEALVVTHGDVDHAGGVTEVRRRLRVARVAGAAPPPHEAESLARGASVRVGPRTTVEVLSPPSTPLAGRESRNDRSLVLLVTLGERRVLVAADIEAAAERWLVDSGRSLDADALVVPHHGSRTSSTPAFIEAVSPGVAVVSAGAANQFGHPHPEVVRRYEAAGARVLNTADRGSVTLSFPSGQLEVTTAR